MNDGVKKILVALGLLVGFGVLLNVWGQTCLGIFESRHTCEVRRQNNVNFDNCAQLSWKRCEPLKDGRGVSTPYLNCLDEVRCSCMNRMGSSTCEKL